MKLASILLIVLLLISCNSTPPKQTVADNSAIAITIAGEISDLLSIEKIKPDKIYFVKLDSVNDSLKKDNGLLSTYSYESWWGNLKIDSTDNFLLDVEPGIYTAIAAYGNIEGNGGLDCLVLFPEKMIKSTIIEVKPNTMIYIGKYFLNRGRRGFINDKMEDADEIQKHYYKPLVQEFYKYNSSIIRLVTIAPTLKEIQQSKEIEKTFLKGYQSKFKKTDWEEKINNRLKSLD